MTAEKASSYSMLKHREVKCTLYTSWQPVIKLTRKWLRLGCTDLADHQISKQEPPKKILNSPKYQAEWNDTINQCLLEICQWQSSKNYSSVIPAANVCWPSRSPFPYSTCEVKSYFLCFLPIAGVYYGGCFCFAIFLIYCHIKNEVAG